MNDFDFSIKELLSLSNVMKSELLAEDYSRICEYAINNELGLGFEVLCVQLYEYSIPITDEYYNRLVLYNNSLGLHESEISYMKDLTHLRDLIEIVNEIKPRLSKNDEKLMQDYINQNKWEEAFEAFSTILYKKNISVSEQYYNKLMKYGSLFNEVTRKSTNDQLSSLFFKKDQDKYLDGKKVNEKLK